MDKIEHRRFSFTTVSWRGRPLTAIRTLDYLGEEGVNVLYLNLADDALTTG